MQIRKHGPSFQVLRRIYDERAGRNLQRVVAKVPMSIRSADEAMTEINAQLNERNDPELSPKEMEQFLRAKRVNKAPAAIVKTANAILSEEGAAPDADDLINAFQQMAHALVQDGFIGEMFEACSHTAQAGIKAVDIPDEEAIRIIRAWLPIKKQLEQQGYTVTWYNRIRNAAEDN